MNYVITDIKSRRKKYQNWKEQDVSQRYLSLEKYLELARRIIGRFAPQNAKASLLKSEDAISFVAHHIMLSDWSYDPERKVKPTTYRGYCGKRAIQDYLGVLAEQETCKNNVFGDREYGKKSSYEDILKDERQKRPDQILTSIERQQENYHLLMQIMDNLTETQRKCIIMYYLEELSIINIGLIIGMTPEGVRCSLKKGIAILRDKAESYKINE